MLTITLPPNHPVDPFVAHCARRMAISLGALLSLAASLAVAGDAGGVVTNEQDHPDVPDFISARKEIPADLLDQKKEGTYWIGFPIIGYDPDTLFNIGAKIALSAAYSTGGAGQVRFIFDAPNFKGSPWHLYGSAQYIKNDFTNYFGVGPSTLAPLSFPGSNQTYNKYEDFLDAINQVHDGKT
jgi:hypothetical protein